MNAFVSTAMALAVIASFILGFAGFRIIIGKADRTRGLLMIAAGAVILANVLIWTL
ncbi:MAG TPA: hypothetical protein VMK31_03245 [Sphingomicrobium sp.]|nr:hypothetical protein [Sphingomicrobium sp.]